MKPYVIGIDFGTLSGRCIVLDTRNGQEVGEATVVYPHGVLDRALPSGRPLPPDFALQHPADYLTVLREAIPAALAAGGVSPAEIAAMSVDFTACTPLPIDESGTPLCMREEFRDEPHAYVKLWKHHAAAPEADALNALARARGESWLDYYGGAISPEWLIPKLLEIARHAPDVYRATHRFLEAADWLSLVLTGKETHSAAFAGFKGIWRGEAAGYPSDDFFTALDPALSGVIGTKIARDVAPVPSLAGRLSEAGAALTSLPVGLPLGVPMIDGHCALPGLGIRGAGEMMLIVGTSSCQIVNGKEELPVPGICGSVRDNVIPGYVCYEAAQAAVGDMYAWFTDNALPAEYRAAADAAGVSVHRYLREKASALRPGESGLIALDWMNGSRCAPLDFSLSTALVGMTLATRPEEIYRAFIESTAYGTRRIVETYRRGGIAVERILAGGGIAHKDPMLMQIYADVLGMEVTVGGTTQAAARGAAIYASVVGGCFADMDTAIASLALPPHAHYRPDPDAVRIYDRLYAEYSELYRYFTEENHVMRRLRP